MKLSFRQAQNNFIFNEDAFQLQTMVLQVEEQKLTRGFEVDLGCAAWKVTKYGLAGIAALQFSQGNFGSGVACAGIPVLDAIFRAATLLNNDIANDQTFNPESQADRLSNEEPK